ncbi:MAG: rhodanese-like domain-containing protein [Candidatus Methylacidiphilales bacterium]
MEPELSPDITMGELLARFPGARRALFRNFHIGGCAQCGFSDTESLSHVCQRYGQNDLNQVAQTILNAHEEDAKLFISPPALQTFRRQNIPHRLIDTRSREEHEAVRIEASEFLTQELSTLLIQTPPSENIHLIFYDHQGRYVLDNASYFIGHGLKNVLCLQGGIDAWSLQIDPALPRYHLE